MTQNVSNIIERVSLETRDGVSRVAWWREQNVENRAVRLWAKLLKTEASWPIIKTEGRLDLTIAAHIGLHDMARDKITQLHAECHIGLSLFRVASYLIESLSKFCPIAKLSDGLVVTQLMNQLEDMIRIQMKIVYIIARGSLLERFFSDHPTSTKNFALLEADCLVAWCVRPILFALQQLQIKEEFWFPILQIAQPSNLHFSMLRIIKIKENCFQVRYINTRSKRSNEGEVRNRCVQVAVFDGLNEAAVVNFEFFSKLIYWNWCAMKTGSRETVPIFSALRECLGNHTVEFKTIQQQTWGTCVYSALFLAMQEFLPQRLFCDFDYFLRHRIVQSTSAMLAFALKPERSAEEVLSLHKSADLLKENVSNFLSHKKREYIIEYGELPLVLQRQIRGYQNPLSSLYGLTWLQRRQMIAKNRAFIARVFHRSTGSVLYSK